MNPLFYPRGLVTSGLVAHYPFGASDGDRKRNLLRYSEDLTNAAWVGTDGTATAADTFTPGVGVANAYLRQTITAKASTDYCFALRLKVPAGVLATKVKLIRGDAGAELASVDVNLTTGYQTVIITGNSGAAQTAIIVQIGGDNTLPEGAVVNATELQLNEGTVPLQYEMTTANQILYDRSPFANHGQLGSTAGSDVNDGSWTAQGLIYGADDFFKIPAAAQINDLSQITIMAAVNLTGWGGGGAGRISDKTRRQFYTQNAYLAYIQVFDGATSGSWRTPNPSLSLTAFTATVTYDRSSILNDPAFYINGITSAATEVATPAGVAVSDASNDLYLGNNHLASRNFDGLQGYYLEYNRILTPAEIARNHQVLRGIMARRGLVITV